MVRKILSPKIQKSKKEEDCCLDLTSDTGLLVPWEERICIGRPVDIFDQMSTIFDPSPNLPRSCSQSGLMVTVWGLWFMVYGSWFWVWGLGFSVRGLRFEVWGLGFKGELPLTIGHAYTQVRD